MKTVFIVAILLLAGLYTYVAFADLFYLSSTGRLGPGFFPRIIGIGLILMCLYTLVMERGSTIRQALSEHWRDATVMALLAVAFVALLDLLGGLLAMIAFMGAALWHFNRGRHATNALVAVLLPIGVYLLFRTWLNAAMPEGLLALPL